MAQEIPVDIWRDGLVVVDERTVNGHRAQHRVFKATLQDFTKAHAGPVPKMTA